MKQRVRRTRQGALRLVATVLTSLGVLLPLGAQPAWGTPRVGILCASACNEITVEGLRDLGYVEGRNIAIERRSAEGHFERLPALAAELVKLRVEVIVAQQGVPSTQAAMGATKVIPIVMTDVGDPVAFGLVASLAKPGGNVTGLSFMAPELTSKQFAFLKEAMPRLSRLAILWNEANPAELRLLPEQDGAARKLRLTLFRIDVRQPPEVDAAFSRITQTRIDAVYVSYDSFMFRHRARILEFLRTHQIPAMTGAWNFVEGGALMSYGPDFGANYRQAAVYVDRLLKGAKAEELAVGQPTKFVLAINLKTARALHLAIPQSLLIRADKVFE